MTCELIRVDFKSGKVKERSTLQTPEEGTVATNLKNWLSDLEHALVALNTEDKIPVDKISVIIHNNGDDVLISGVSDEEIVDSLESVKQKVVKTKTNMGDEE